MEQLYRNETRKFYKKLSASRNGIVPRAEICWDKEGGILKDEREVIERGSVQSAENRSAECRMAERQTAENQTAEEVNQQNGSIGRISNGRKGQSAEKQMAECFKRQKIQTAEKPIGRKIVQQKCC